MIWCSKTRLGKIKKDHTRRKRWRYLFHGVLFVSLKFLNFNVVKLGNDVFSDASKSVTICNFQNNLWRQIVCESHTFNENSC